MKFLMKFYKETEKEKEWEREALSTNINRRYMRNSIYIRSMNFITLGRLHIKFFICSSKLLRWWSGPKLTLMHTKPSIHTLPKTCNIHLLRCLPRVKLKITYCVHHRCSGKTWYCIFKFWLTQVGKQATRVKI